MAKLTLRRLEAIEEALSSRLAGPIENVEPLTEKDYEAAYEWVIEQIRKKEAKKA